MTQFVRLTPTGPKTLDHPGWYSGGDEARLLTDDELCDMQYGLIVVSNPKYDPATHIAIANPIADWVLTERTAETTYTYEVKPPEPFPTISPAQLRLTLRWVGITEAHVDAALAGDPDAQIIWKYATYFTREHPLIEQFSPAFNIPPEQIDALWWYATRL
jgi:hypothetical protein